MMKFSKEILPFVKEIDFPKLFRVFRNDGIGRTVPVPLPVIAGKICSPFTYLRAIALFDRWDAVKLSNGHIFVPSLNFEESSFYYFWLLAAEWKYWENCYLPVSVKGKTVLDAGAACGDTRMLFFYNGAKRVISIEPDSERFACMKRNSEANGWEGEMINDVMRLEHLEMGFDFAKIDIEAHETELLKLRHLPPCAIETHGEEIADAFVKKFGMRKLKGGGKHWNVVTNCH